MNRLVLQKANSVNTVEDELEDQETGGNESRFLQGSVLMLMRA